MGAPVGDVGRVVHSGIDGAPGVGDGMGPGEVFHQEYPDPVRYALWVISAGAIIASDVPEVIGTALALGPYLIIPRGSGWC